MLKRRLADDNLCACDARAKQITTSRQGIWTMKTTTTKSSAFTKADQYEEMIRELWFQLGPLLESGQITDMEANEWVNMKSDQWANGIG